MCAPMYIKSEETMYEGVLDYARNYKKFEGKTAEQINAEMEEFKNADEHVESTAGFDCRCQRACGHDLFAYICRAGAPRSYD